MLTKSDFKQYLTCHKFLWMLKHKRDELKLELDLTQEFMLEQANVVEGYAQQLFQNSKMLGKGETMNVENVKELLAQGVRTFFQPTITDGILLARADILEWDEIGKYWVINEVKSSKNKPDSSEEKKELEDHVIDTTFQKIVCERAGFPVGKVNLILLNGDYVRHGEVKAEDLLVKVDVTTQVKKHEPEVMTEIEQALKLIEMKGEPEHAHLTECCASNKCPCFEWCYKDLPDYNIYDLSRITMSKKKVKALEDMEIWDIRDVPDDFELSDPQRNQVITAKLGKPMMNNEAIRDELASLQYPLYFLDYETFGGAIPLFDGYSPYDNVVFQYSLHVIREPGAAPEHFEFLTTQSTDPVKTLLETLKERVGDKGSVLVWNQSFEKYCNREMGERVPTFKEFTEALNGRIYDLRDIFTKQYYVHPGFRGRTSIKKILPVLMPGKRYTDLEISEGGTASISWYRMISGAINRAESELTSARLLAYCALDTMAMVDIFNILKDI